MSDHSSFRNILRASFAKLGHVCLSLSKKIYTSPREQEKQRYVKDERERSLRVRYPLTSQSVVLDVGGYEGQWASDIVAMYGCTVHVFEPVPAFAEQIRQRFQHNPLVHVHAYGLGAKDETLEIALLENGTSLFRNETGANTQSVAIRDISHVWKELALDQVGLMKMNIEGAEYPLLARMDEQNLLSHVRDFQIQFHDFVPEAKQELKKAQTALAKTHRPTYQYAFIWENWERTNSVPANQAEGR
jgi:FkbM family methyltransferase